MNEEKRTFGEFVKENKGKIIKGALIVTGLAVGALAITKLCNGGIGGVTEMVKNLNPGEIAKDGLEKLTDVA